ncbi:hypothetical protein V6N12_059913 [Hibiscus sabdariffa]|uniref:Uncharacterized protein n=1 Tax=Hibiscus sabdariffa TaxID=183260 RepID=A0ABR2D3A2_9ROSI
MIFDVDRVDRDSVLTRGQRLITECEEGFASSQTIPNQVIHDNVCWNGPERGWVKGNVDATMDPVSGKAEIGGVLRDATGSWLFGFSLYIGRSSIPSYGLDSRYKGCYKKRRWEDQIREANLVNQCSPRVDPGGDLKEQVMRI